MNLKQLIDEANNLADDFLTDEEAIGFINDAISSINIETEATFPFLVEENDEPAFPEEWQRMLIIPFAKARIKEKDSSQFEWETAYQQYYNNLEVFKKYYEIPDEFKRDQRSDIVKMVDLLANNKLSASDTLNFINDGIAAINIEVGSSYPHLDSENEETAIPVDWQRMLLVPYAKSRIKEMEGDSAEWEVAYSQFQENLETFKDTYEIPKEYQRDNPSDLVKWIISLSDKRLRTSDVLEFINDAIAAINIEVDADFPFLETMYDEPALPETWQRMLIIPYAKARMKEKDSSQYEWESGYEQFFANLQHFQKNYLVPEEYQNKESKFSGTQGNMLEQVPYGWGGW